MSEQEGGRGIGHVYSRSLQPEVEEEAAGGGTETGAVWQPARTTVGAYVRMGAVGLGEKSRQNKESLPPLQ